MIRLVVYVAPSRFFTGPSFLRQTGSLSFVLSHGLCPFVTPWERPGNGATPTLHTAEKGREDADLQNFGFLERVFINSVSKVFINTDEIARSAVGTHGSLPLAKACWNDQELSTPSTGAVTAITVECCAHTRKGQLTQTRRGGWPRTDGGDVGES